MLLEQTADSSRAAALIIPLQCLESWRGKVEVGRLGVDTFATGNTFSCFLPIFLAVPVSSFCLYSCSTLAKPANLPRRLSLLLSAAAAMMVFARCHFAVRHCSCVKSERARLARLRRGSRLHAKERAGGWTGRCAESFDRVCARAIQTKIQSPSTPPAPAPIVLLLLFAEHQKTPASDLVPLTLCNPKPEASA